MFPTCSVLSKARLGSDHTPIIVDIGAIKIPKNEQFRIEKWWLHVEVLTILFPGSGQLLVSVEKPLIDGSSILGH
jgi:hypothetical protein